MAVITKEFGSGGRGLTPNTGNVSLATALRDICADLAGLKPAAVASANATDLATAITLVNEIKTRMNAVNGYTLLSTAG